MIPPTPFDVPVVFDLFSKMTNKFWKQKLITKIVLRDHPFNPLQPGVAFQYPLKTSENLKVF